MAVSSRLETGSGILATRMAEKSGSSAQSAWRQLLEAGMQVTEVTRAQAQRVVKQLVKEGQVAEERAKGYVDELVSRSRKRTEELTKLVRREIADQASALGLATQEDLKRLENKLTSSTPAQRSKSSKASKSSKSSKSSKKSSAGSKSAKTSRSGSTGKNE